MPVLGVLDLMRPSSVVVRGDLTALDGLHEASRLMAINQQKRHGTCAHLWTFVRTDKDTPLVLETRWSEAWEKELVVGAIRHMLAASSKEVVRYSYVGEGYAIPVSPEPGTSPRELRKRLPESFRDHPMHYEILMVFAFERSGGSKALVYNYPTGRPEERTVDERGGDYAGEMWNLFEKPKAY